MKKREYSVHLEITGAEAITRERIVFVQNDAASGRLRFVITLNGETYPLEGLTGEISFWRPDGQVIIGGLQFDDEGAYYDLQSSELFCAGTVNISVNLYDSTGRLTCARFPIYAEKELDTSEGVDASLNYPTLLEITNRLNQLESRAAELENQLQAGELTGDSAYEIALQNGFTGTQNEWLDSIKGVDGKSPIISDTGEWVVYNDVTDQYEATDVSAANGVHASDIPTQRGMSVQEELNMLFSLAPGETKDVTGYFETADSIGVRLTDDSQTVIKVYGENLFYPQDTYVEGGVNLNAQALDISLSAQILEMSEQNIRLKSVQNNQSATFCFSGLANGKYYLRITPSANVNVAIYSRKQSFSYMTSCQATANQNAECSFDVTDTVGDIYIAFYPASINSEISLSNFIFTKKDTSPTYSVPCCQTVINSQLNPPITMGILPQWAVWGKTSAPASVRLLKA